MLLINNLIILSLLFHTTLGVLGFWGFGKFTPPYVGFEIEKKKKNQIFIEFLDGTKKVQLAGKKKFPSPQKKFP